ncbi:UvrD/REP helicase N-terminal domain-containing protein [Collimonas sp. OK242]|uniref:UvrD-helicase domain-containing protein n=1 Tax=Collimonas sp. OK242 TaxID=1798195 RepID=UPI00089D3FED|nr:UvrD-helicase domain-containing protein [Collimonas sp. OK242]SDY80745.1 UvrD/REP helicase N-terminal domain-containing protein [Collimonas sp. OK242]
MSLENMRYIVIDRIAVGELVGDRSFQSTDFPNGQALAFLILGKSVDFPINKRVAQVMIKQGLYLLSRKEESHDVLVIDLQEAPLFDKRSDSEALLLFQKVIRFAIKRWEKMSFTWAERVLPNSTKGLLFPFANSAQVPFRITFELAPDQRRREKRAKGEELLVYKCGNEEGGGAAEEAGTTNFKKAIEALPEAQAACLKLKDTHANEISTVIGVTRLDGNQDFPQVGDASFEEWMPLLTRAQRDFIEADVVAPHRIEGPAGTGKTLSLVLKCIATLRKAHQGSGAHSALFIAHSDATRRNIAGLFQPEFDKGIISADGVMSLQSVKVTTLQAYCAEVLNTEISESEFLDRDAFESKQAQLLYTLEALDEAIETHLPTHRSFMTAEFIEFIEREDRWVVAEMLQHEVSVKIKGRADEDETKYRKLPRLAYGLPVKNDGDKVFAFLAFKGYRKRLERAGQFDTDDIILSALGQLNTPIWRRRRSREAFDSIYIDETHLFNVNELSVFHKLTKSESFFPIVYSADVSQSLGDRGWDNETFDEAMGVSEGKQGEGSSTVFSSIFRCSPDIVSLAFSVTSSGATLFTNFHDPVAAASSAFTYEEEKKCALPHYWMLGTDEQMLKKAFARADELSSELGCAKADVAIVVFSDGLFAEAEKLVKATNKPVETIKRRGDSDVVKRARQGGRFILTTADYVGGLEFSAVILVGVDQDRVPPKPSESQPESLNFLSYASHQRLYVAITRARYRVEIMGLETRGTSSLLATALANKLIAKS